MKNFSQQTVAPTYHYSYKADICCSFVVQDMTLLQSTIEQHCITALCKDKIMVKYIMLASLKSKCLSVLLDHIFWQM